jgi:hypothetical protein
MESIADIVGKLINSNISPNISNIDENNKINVIRLPTDLDESYRYIDLFKTLIDQQRNIIPLALIKKQRENENDLPIVLINPHPLSQLHVPILQNSNRKMTFS